MKHSCNSGDSNEDGPFCYEDECNFIPLYNPHEPHGFPRNASHAAGCYACECEGRVPYEETNQYQLEIDLLWDRVYALESKYISHIEPVGWTHNCDVLLANDIRLWINKCPHCGKPRPTNK